MASSVVLSSLFAPFSSSSLNLRMKKTHVATASDCSYSSSLFCTSCLLQPLTPSIRPFFCTSSGLLFPGLGVKMVLAAVPGAVLPHTSISQPGSPSFLFFSLSFLPFLFLHAHPCIANSQSEHRVWQCILDTRMVEAEPWQPL